MIGCGVKDMGDGAELLLRCIAALYGSYGAKPC